MKVVSTVHIQISSLKIRRGHCESKTGQKLDLSTDFIDNLIHKSNS